MAYALEYEVPADAAFYRRVREGIGDERPAGLIAHVVTGTGRGLRHFGVWQSKGDWERFRDERVEPALAQAFADAGVPHRPPAPATTELEVVDYLVGG